MYCVITLKLQLSCFISRAFPLQYMGFRQWFMYSSDRIKCTQVAEIKLGVLLLLLFIKYYHYYY